MRDIKFRAKCIHDGSWVYGLPVHYNSNPRYEKWTIHEDSGIESDIDRKTLGQFTGIKDKNGTDIYEGDIVKTLISLPNATKNKEYRNFPVVYSTISTSFWNTFDSYLFQRNLVEVIGNVYDNPELLNTNRYEEN